MDDVGYLIAEGFYFTTPNGIFFKLCFNACIQIYY